MVSRRLKASVRLGKKFGEIREALGPQIHDDAAVHEAWEQTDDAAHTRSFTRLNIMLARSTASINNSYTKVQITTGLTIGFIAVLVTIFGQLKDVNGWLLIAAVLVNVVSIGVSQMVTTPRINVWTEPVKTPGVITLTQTDKEEHLALSHRVHHNRVVLLGNRRLSWAAVWLLSVPGLLLAMLAWSWVGALLTLVAIIAITWAYKKWIGPGRPTLSKEYPAS